MVHPGELWNGEQCWEERSYSKSCVFRRWFVKCGLKWDKPEDFSASHPDCIHNPAPQAGRVLVFPPFPLKTRFHRLVPEQTHMWLCSLHLDQAAFKKYTKVDKSSLQSGLFMVLCGERFSVAPLHHDSQITLQPVQTGNKLPGFASFWDTGVDLVSKPLVH